MKMSGQEGYELDYVAHVIAYRPPHRTASNTRQTWVLTAKDWILDARVRVSVNSSHLIPPLWLRPASLQQPVFVRLEGFVSTGNTTVTSDMPPTELSSTSDSRISWFNRASPPSFTSLSSSPGLLAPKVNRMSGSAFGTDEALPVYTQILSGSTSIVRDTALISRLERQWNAGPGRQDEFPSSSFASLVSSRPGPSTLRPLHLHPVANPSSGSPFLWQPHDHHQRTRTHDNSTDNAGDSNTTGLNGVYNCDLFRRPSQLRSLLSNLTGQTVSMFAVYSDDHCAQPDINSLLSSISSSTSISSRLPTLASLSSSSRKNVSQSQAPLPRDDSSHGSILNPSPTIPLTSHSLRTPSAPLLLRHALLRRVCTSCNFSSFASAVSPPSLLSSLPSLPSFPPFPSSSSWSCPMCHPCSQQLIPSQSTSHRSDHPGWTWQYSHILLSLRFLATSTPTMSTSTPSFPSSQVHLLIPPHLVVSLLGGITPTQLARNQWNLPSSTLPPCTSSSDAHLSDVPSSDLEPLLALPTPAATVADLLASLLPPPASIGGEQGNPSDGRTADGHPLVTVLLKRTVMADAYGAFVNEVSSVEDVKVHHS